MSDQAWASLIATDEFATEDIERMLQHFVNTPGDFLTFYQDVKSGKTNVHPRYFTGIDFERTEVKAEEAFEAWRVNIWKQAVLHGEYKARLGIETHWLLYYIVGMNFSPVFGHKFAGFVPLFSPCSCCWENKLLLNENDEYEEYNQCQVCIDAGHEPGPGMDFRWHTYLGSWWVEKLESNGPDYFPSSFPIWYDEDSAGEVMAIEVAKKARVMYASEDKIFIYNPKGEREEITA